MLHIKNYNWICWTLHLMFPQTMFFHTESTTKNEATTRSNNRVNSRAQRTPWMKCHPTLTVCLQIEFLKLLPHEISCFKKYLPGSALRVGSPARRRWRTQDSASSLAPGSTITFLRSLFWFLGAEGRSQGGWGDPCQSSGADPQVVGTDCTSLMREGCRLGRSSHCCFLPRAGGNTNGGHTSGRKSKLAALKWQNLPPPLPRLLPRWRINHFPPSC